MCPDTITGEPLPSDAPTPETNRPQQLTVTNSELPGSQVPSADRRRELIATRNFSTSWSPPLRRFGSLTTLPTTVSGVSNISHLPFSYRTATGAAGHSAQDHRRVDAIPGEDGWRCGESGGCGQKSHIRHIGPWPPRCVSTTRRSDPIRWAHRV